MSATAQLQWEKNPFHNVGWIANDFVDFINRIEHLHPPGLLPIGMNAGNSLFMLGLARELAGQVFFLSTFHVPSPMSFDHVGFVARSFTDFLSAARPDDPPLP